MITTLNACGRKCKAYLAVKLFGGWCSLYRFMFSKCMIYAEEGYWSQNYRSLIGACSEMETQLCVARPYFSLWNLIWVGSGGTIQMFCHTVRRHICCHGCSAQRKATDHQPKTRRPPLIADENHHGSWVGSIFFNRSVFSTLNAVERMRSTPLNGVVR